MGARSRLRFRDSRRDWPASRFGILSIVPMVTRLGRATDGPIPTAGIDNAALQGLLPLRKALAPLLKHWIPPLLSPPQQCSKSNGFVQIGCTLCTPNLDSEHNERGGSIRGDREGGAGGRGRESKSGREKCASRRKRSAARARAGGERGCEKKTEPDARGVGSDRVTWPRPRWSSTSHCHPLGLLLLPGGRSGCRC